MSEEIVIAGSRRKEDRIAMHYGVDAWVDFARGLIGGEDAARMKEHLVSGCSECAPIADFCRSVYTACRRIKRGTVPRRVVRRAKSIFPGGARTGGVRYLIAELISGRFVVPRGAGWRAGRHVRWRGMYRGGGCSLDLRIEPAPRSSRTTVTGHVSKQEMPDGKMAGLAVCLKSERAVVAETRSNAFGEFAMEYEHQGWLQLCVYLEEGAQCIQVPLMPFATQMPLSREQCGRTPAARKSPVRRFR